MICSATHDRAIAKFLTGATCAAMLVISAQSPAAAQQKENATLPSESPAHFQPVATDFDFERRDAMILMRDGVKLHTVILIPKGAKNAPILLTRTPYNADGQVSHRASSHLGPALWGYDNATEAIVEAGYIRAIQDIRGNYNTEAYYVITRPLPGPLNPSPVDHSTDTYDTIDWLVKNIPETHRQIRNLGS